MKKEKVQPRLDFYQILFRRKWSVARWLENESIASQEQFDAWIKSNEDKFTYSEKFLSEASLCFVKPQTQQEKIVVAEEETAPVSEISAPETLDQPVLVVKGKNKKKVQSEEETE